jgi:hypothetical protein
MGLSFPTIRGRLDRAGMLLSCLCAVHCVLGIVIVAGLGIGGGLLLDPIFHRVGLLLATVIAGVAIGIGAIQHRRPLPFVGGDDRLSFMGGALAVEHGRRGDAADDHRRLARRHRARAQPAPNLLRR